MFTKLFVFVLEPKNCFEFAFKQSFNKFGSKFKIFTKLVLIFIVRIN